MKTKQIGNLCGGKWEKTNEQSRRVYDADYLSPTICTMGGGNQEIKIMLRARGCAVRGRGENNMQTFEENGTECANTITTVQKDSMVALEQLRIRKLTPKECWRLMGRTDEDFEKAAEVNSNAQLYKQAGNSIVVNVLECLFSELFKQYPFSNDLEVHKR